MRLLEPVRQYPVALLAVVALAFVSWVWWDALPAAAPQVPHMPPEMSRFDVSIAPSESAAFATVLPKLKPGMTRAEVEHLAGAPENIHPATVTGDRVTYHTAYEADFGAPPTVRPIRPMPKPPADPSAPRAIVTLEFDATRPGHPLLNVHYPDPLF